MNEKSPRPSYLRLVVNNSEQKASVTPEKDTTKENAQLTNLWVELRKNLPSNYVTACDEDLIDKARAEVKCMTAEELYTYLSSLTVWDYITYTTAVLDEVHLRVLRKDFAPRS